MTINSIRSQFPAFSTQGSPGRLCYLDSAASAQKPQLVVDRMSYFNLHEYANVARGAYELSAHASELFEDARAKVVRFIGAASSREVIFTRGSTDALNLVSASLAETFVAGDAVLISMLEHHSNIVPWQLAQKRHNLKLSFSPITATADLDYAELFELIELQKPRVVSVTQLSNAFGTLVKIGKIAEVVHRHGGLLVVDCAQSIAHLPINVADLGADFIVFSGHKLYGPSGIGVLWGKEEHLSMLPPYQGGGGMISLVTCQGTSWADLPHRFEAGTPAIAEAIGLGEAIDFISGIGFDWIQEHEHDLFEYAWESLVELDGVTPYGPRNIEGGLQRSIISFSVENIHPHDLATVLDQHGVQIRAGHHCAMPALAALGLPATARVSLGLYSEREDIDQLVVGIRAAQRILG